jgi:DNA polymerase (family 10)
MPVHNSEIADVFSKVADGDDLSKLDGIGEDLAGKIAEIVETGDLQLLRETKQRTPTAPAIC